MTSFSSKTLSDRAGTGPTSDRKAGSTLKKGTLPSSGATMTTARNRSSSRRTGGIDWESRYWRMERDAVRLAEGNDELLGMLSTCEQRVAVRQEEQKTVDLEAQFRESVLRDEAKMMLYGEEFVLRRVAEEANRVSPQAEIHAASQSLATLEMVVETELEKGSESVRTFLLAELRERDSQLEASRKALVDKQSELRALQNTMLAEQKVVYPPVAAKVEISRRSEDWQEAEREMQCYRADVSYLADEYVNARSELGEMRRQQLYSDSQQRSVEAANQALAEAIVSETEAYKEEARQLVIARDKRPVRWIDRPGSTREFIEDGKKYVQASLVNFRKVTSNHSATRAEGAERARSVRHDDALGAKHDKIRSDEKAALTKEQAEASARLAEEEQDAINSVLFSGDNSQQSLIKYKKAKIRFMEAARVNDVKQVQDFVNLCGGWATNVIDGFRRTALMYAGAAGSMDVVQFLTGSPGATSTTRRS
eukprot:TRINITY_DN22769_c0_g1_i2.p1 TRINITY_DN22769_c0_g1~~TRINITY_DN22769_c0_g1_i2.p1  ORF type:complete len:480 (-),score=94.90 TRINITY_DN22769_c0_g1_i2:397-1836(-)